MKWLSLCLFVLLVGCAGLERGCSASWAETVSSNWIIVQLAADGTPFRCWELRDVSVGNEERSDGIYWLSEDGHLVHISGFYNRVQVERDWASAYSELGLTASSCEQVRNQRYNPAERSYR